MSEDQVVSDSWWDTFWATGDTLIKVGSLAALYLLTSAWERKAPAPRKRSTRKQKR